MRPDLLSPDQITSYLSAIQEVVRLDEQEDKLREHYRQLRDTAVGPLIEQQARIKQSSITPFHDTFLWTALYRTAALQNGDIITRKGNTLDLEGYFIVEGIDTRGCISQYTYTNTNESKSFYPLDRAYAAICDNLQITAQKILLSGDTAVNQYRHRQRFELKEIVKVDLNATPLPKIVVRYLKRRLVKRLSKE